MAVQGLNAAVPVKSADTMLSGRKKAGDERMDFADIMSGSLRGESQKNQNTVKEMKDTSLQRPETYEKSRPIKEDYIKDTSVTKPAESQSQKDSLSALESKVKEIVKDTLEITDEELEKVMSILGLNVLDLLDVNHLQSFMMELSGSEDVSEILMDEALTFDLTSLRNNLQSIDLTEFQITPEQLEAAITDKGNLEQTAEEEPLMNPLLASTEEEPDLDEVSTEKAGGLASNKQGSQSSIDAEESTFKVELVKAEGSGSAAKNGSEGNLNQSNSDMSQNAMAQGLTDRFADSMIKGTESFEAAAQQASGVRDIIQQIVEQIRVTIRPNASSMELQLNPENLGKVNLQVAVKDGLLTASFIAQNQLAKEAIESQIHILKESFAQQNIKVEAIEVTVSNFGFDQSDGAKGDNEGQKKSSAKKAFQFDEVDGQEMVSEESISGMSSVTGNGLSIDYSA